MNAGVSEAEARLVFWAKLERKHLGGKQRTIWKYLGMQPHEYAAIAAWLARVVGGHAEACGAGFVVRKGTLTLEEPKRGLYGGKDKRLEGEDEARIAQEDAENELNKELNALPRKDVVCSACGSRGQPAVSWSRMEFQCTTCKATSLLPPAAPFIKRQATNGHLHFMLHGEDAESLRPVLPEGGAYHVQWRGVASADAPTIHDQAEWEDPKFLVKPRTTVSKRNLDQAKQYQVRVRARLAPCKCGHGSFATTDENGDSTAKRYLQCGDEESGCVWTPWSHPSALVSPTCAAEATSAEATVRALGGGSSSAAAPPASSIKYTKATRAPRPEQLSAPKLLAGAYGGLLEVHVAGCSIGIDYIFTCTLDGSKATILDDP